VKRTKGEGETLREVTVKIGLERIDMQKEITIEALLYSGVMGLVMSLDSVRKQGFKLKKIKRLIYIRNIDKTFNKEKLIKNTMEVNIYYQEHRERTEINVIGGKSRVLFWECCSLLATILRSIGKQEK